MTTLVAVDGGGTHTTLIAVEREAFNADDLSQLKTTTVGAANLYNFGLEYAHLLGKEVQRGLDQLEVNPKECFFVGGFSGLENQHYVDAATNEISRLGVPNPRVMCDTDLALRALNDSGVIAILGSGSNFVGKQGSRRKQVGGLGPQSCMAGSGFQLGLDTFNAALTIIDRGGDYYKNRVLYRNSVLPALVLKELGWSDFTGALEFFSARNATENRERFSKLAPILFEAVELDDLVAPLILDDHAEGVASALGSICNELRLSRVDIGLVGGIALNPAGEKHLLRRVLSHPALDGIEVTWCPFGSGAGQKNLLVEAMRNTLNVDS